MSREREVDLGRLVGVVPILILLFAILYVIWDSTYTVDTTERAVVFRLGKVITTTESGLHTKIPFLDEIVRVRTDEQEIRLPFEQAPTGQSRNTGHEDEALMLTGDLNAAIVEWTIQWKVLDPAKFITAIDVDSGEAVIRNVARSVMLEKIGDYSIDEILTSKRTEVGNKARDTLQKTLDSYGSGIQITGLQMQRVTPPALVKPSFDEVNASVQKRDQLINEANSERNKLIPTAEAMRDRLIREAEGYADRRRAETNGEITALIDQYHAYKEAPAVTRQRLYLEAMEEILAGSGQKIILDAELKGLLPMLDLGNLPSASPKPASSTEGQ